MFLHSSRFSLPLSICRLLFSNSICFRCNLLPTHPVQSNTTSTVYPIPMSNFNQSISHGFQDASWTSIDFRGRDVHSPNPPKSATSAEFSPTPLSYADEPVSTPEDYIAFNPHQKSYFMPPEDSPHEPSMLSHGVGLGHQVRGKCLSCYRV